MSKPAGESKRVPRGIRYEWTVQRWAFGDETYLETRLNALELEGWSVHSMVPQGDQLVIFAYQATTE